MSSWGTQFKYGDFEIVGARDGKPRLLGKGSFGKTFEAVHIDTVVGQDIKEYVAVKVLDPALLTSASNRFQFIQELKALTKFQHPNLIHYIRCGEQNGEVYYAMELCRGGDLAQLVRRYGPLPEKVVALIGLQVAMGLREVHQKHRLVHRDLKPSNIMLVDEIERDMTVQYLGFHFEQQDSLCRVVDFGLVNFALSAEEAPQRFVGSPMYASPEQICEQPVDGRSDIYSLGMTLWYLLQGKGPLLDGAGEDLKDMREAMRRHTNPDEHDKDFPRHLSTEFRSLLAKLVAKRPEQRFGSAAELLTAIRQYLTGPVTQPAVEESVAVTRMSLPLDTAFVLESALPSRMAYHSYLAVEKTSGVRVKLNAVADLQRDEAENIDALTRYLCGLAEMSQLPGLPPALLPVRDVIVASDTLACTEEMVPHVALAEVLRARALAKRALGFSEAVSFLRPIAEALDFMIEQGRPTVFLPCEEVWLTGRTLMDNPQDTQVLIRPLTDWEDLQVHFSMMCLPVGGGADAGGGEGAAGETLSGSLHMSDADLHPVPAFVRLVYRTLNGSEVAAAAGFTPNAYVPAVTLVHASNVLLRDLLCRQKPWTTVSAVLRDLCSNEGIPWRPSPGRSGGATVGRTDAGTMTRGGFGAASQRSLPGQSRLSQTRPNQSHPSQSQPSQSQPNQSQPGSSFGAGSRGAAAESGPRELGGSAGSSMGSGPSPIDSLARTVGPAGSYQMPPSGSRGSSFGSVNRAEASMMPGEREKLCEIVSPGVVRSPYDPNQNEQQVAADQWAPNRRVRCQVTQKHFRLPPKLDPLVPTVSSPGVIQSPYAAAGVTQRVPWEEWIPGGRVVCEASAKPLTLPFDLPLPEGILPPDGAGAVLSPYARGTLISVEPAHWEPGAEIVCPVTHMSFALPQAIPALVAFADRGNPGVLATPYAPEVTWRIAPPEWVAGGQVECPASHRPLTLPAEVETWPAEAVVAEAARRMVSNPFRPGSSIQVPASAWIPRGRINCPQTGRVILLPADLPPLVGELVDDRVGIVRSPYNGDVVQVGLNDWVAGAQITCPKTRATFQLPGALPEWIGMASVSGLPPGRVRSPYAPFPEVDVAPNQWQPNQRLTCPQTGRRFSLPADLPDLVGTVQQGQPGKVFSPFSLEWQDVALDAWKGGQKVECAVTKRQFLLPSTLSEWLVDGAWVVRAPGRIRSPFQPRQEFDIAADQWKQGGLLTCPATKRRFRIPADPLLPSLELEKDAFQQALAEPDATAQAAAEALKGKHAGVTAGQVQAIWERHGFGTIEDRLAAEETGEALPNAPGFVHSPYGSHPEVEVAPAQWVKTGATAHCRETGRRFKLPGNLPPLSARVNPDQPGVLVSPYAPAAPWRIPAEEWVAGRTVSCLATGNPLTLPPEVEKWPGEAVLVDASVRLVSNPFRPGKNVQVPGLSWGPGARIACPETGRPILLPRDLPPLIGEAIDQQTGVVRSPYSGETVAVTLANWIPGGSVTCPKTNAQFLLPATLPEWIAAGSIENLPPGKVKSPYEPFAEMTVAPGDWLPNQILTCSKSGRRFSLPAELPLLDGKVEQGKPGVVISPFSPAPQKVSLDDWQPGGELVCTATNRPFVLPQALDDWLVDGTWVPGSPGRIRSPFRPNPQTDVPAELWKAGGLITCALAKRRFRIPADDLFPSLELEKDAVRQAWAEPDATAEAAAGNLKKKHSKVTAAQVQSIWTRHRLGTMEERKAGEQTGEAVPGSPDEVRSPYGARPVVKVTTAQRVVAQPSALCPETGRRFKLPDNLPPLAAMIDPEQPGKLRTPYSAEASWSIPPNEWTAASQVACPVSGRPLTLPAEVEKWPAEAAVANFAQRLVTNPFVPGETVEVPAPSWSAGRRIACPLTGRTILLPADLPPLQGELVENGTGVILSPYCGDAVPVALKDWLPGTVITCPKTRLPLALPATLPEWIADGSIENLPLGKVKSPYEPFAEVTVPPEQWVPNQILTCPKSGRRFKLPAKIPLLEGAVKAGSPGKARSPFSSEWQDVPMDEWIAEGAVKCAVTLRPFALPAKLEEWLVDGTWVAGSAGRIRSPFRPNPMLDIPAEQWKSGGLVTCPATKRRFRIPAAELFPSLELEKDAVSHAWREPDATSESAAGELRQKHRSVTAPQVQAIWDRHGMGTIEARKGSEQTGEVVPGSADEVLSPYGARPTVRITTEQRVAAHPSAVCPETGRRFKLPEGLPPLSAIADVENPGTLRTPYDPDTSWPIPPTEWTAGRQVSCPISGKALTLPQEVESWPAEAGTVDPAQRQVGNPFLPGEHVPVPAAEWSPGARIACPLTGRTIILPANLPPLTAELIEGRNGAVRSPYSGEVVQLSLNDWIPGAAITCPKANVPFLLPASLPEWMGVGDTENLRAGKVRSPYQPFPEVTVAPEEWIPEQILVCPATGRRFRLPADLDLLEGAIKEGNPGRVLSPYSGEWQVVPLDDWKPGKKMECLATERPFVLPAKVEEWLVEGKWVPGSPGRIRSPFRPNPEIDIPAELWKAGGLLTCPATKRRFRIPSDYLFPSLELEKDAVQCGLADPETTEDAVAEALSAHHPGTTSAQVQSIWERHHMGTIEERRGNVETGEALPENPGFVLSPYGSHPRVEVSVEDWIEPHAAVRCTETGRLFVLPENLPSLHAQLVPDQPGMVVSPFVPNEPFQVSPEIWKAGCAFRCPKSGRPLQMPYSLPEWNPEGTVKDGQPGTVFSPFGRKLAMKVSGAEWVGGAPITCVHSGYTFTLPAKIPPMTGNVVPGVVGRALSPYASGSEAQVPRKQWAPGERVICPQTGRVFLLPATLPVWEGRKVPVLPLAAAALVVLAVGGWLIFGKGGGKTATNGPAQTNAGDSSAKGVEPATPPVKASGTAPASPKPWPQSIVLHRGIEPENALIFLSAGGGKRIQVYADEVAGLRRIIDLSAPKNAGAQNWLRDNDQANEWRLELQAPRFEPIVFESSPYKIGRGKTEDAYEIERTISLGREKGTVSWPGKDPFYAAVYSGLKFESNNPLPGDKDPEVQPVNGDGMALATGEYTVTLAGKKGFSEDRVVTANFAVEKGKTQEVKLTPPLPLYFAGLGVYKGFGIPCSAYGDRSSTDVHITITAFASYWTPSVVAFDPNYRNGRLVDENSFAGPDGFSMMDTVVSTLAQQDQKQKPGKALSTYPGYTENRPWLTGMFDALKPPASFQGADAATLLKKRQEMFDDAAKIWSGVEKRHLATLVEKNAQNQQNNLMADYQWLLKLRAAMESPPWEHIVSAALKPGPAEIDWKDVKALEEPVHVANADLRGLFVEQRFSVKSVDKDGRAHLKVEILFVNSYDLAASFPLEWNPILERKPDGTYKFSAAFDDTTSRETVLSPANVTGGN